MAGLHIDKPEMDHLRSASWSRRQIVVFCQFMPLQEYFDISAFAVPGLDVYGNCPRDVLFGPGRVQTDFSMFECFPLPTESRYVHLRGEFFNLFNTPQFNNPSGCTSVAQGCGSITSAASPPTLQRTSRQIQVALKLVS
jgi:hypothetical protein